MTSPATGSAATRVLVVAATEPELCGGPGLACGVGPVEAASATAPRARARSARCRPPRRPRGRPRARPRDDRRRHRGRVRRHLGGDSGRRSRRTRPAAALVGQQAASGRARPAHRHECGGGRSASRRRARRSDGGGDGGVRASCARVSSREFRPSSSARSPTRSASGIAGGGTWTQRSMLWQRCCRWCPPSSHRASSVRPHGAGSFEDAGARASAATSTRDPHGRPARGRDDQALRLGHLSGTSARAGRRVREPAGTRALEGEERPRARGGGAGIRARILVCLAARDPYEGAARLVGCCRRRGDARVPARGDSPSLVRARRRRVAGALRAGGPGGDGRGDVVRRFASARARARPRGRRARGRVRLPRSSSSSSSRGSGSRCCSTPKRRTRFEPRSSSPISSFPRCSSSAVRSCTSTRRLG